MPSFDDSLKSITAFLKQPRAFLLRATGCPNPLGLLFLTEDC